MNIKNLNKAQVLAALYNNAKAQGMGVFAFDPKTMTADEAQEIEIMAKAQRKWH